MKYIGAHFSISNGFDKAVQHAKNYGANALAIFTKSNMQWKSSIITEDIEQSFFNECKLNNINKSYILPHASYLINVGNPNKEKQLRAKNALIEEMKRCKQLGLNKLNFHPGSGLGIISEAQTIKNIGKCVKDALEEVTDVSLIFETTAGTGFNVGYRFEHLRDLISESNYFDRTGVCIDTCHIFCAGYNLKTDESYENTMFEFDKIIGFKYLKGMHLNDTKNDIGSRKDRHESLGSGYLGYYPFNLIIKDKRTDNIPLILETPNSSLWKYEINLLKQYE